MFPDDDDNISGITIESVSVNKNFHGTSSYLSYCINIRVDEPIDVAQVDIKELEERICVAVEDIVIDYGEDGQEVE